MKVNPMSTIILLCNPNIEYSIRETVNDVKKTISNGKPHKMRWSCGGVKKIQVGDLVYLLRTVIEPRGFFAFGRVIPAPEQEQLRLINKAYHQLSAAYLNDIYGNSSYKTQFSIESIVDFDFPLSIKQLKQHKDLRNANFSFQQSGCEFDPRYIESLNNEWQTHSMVMCDRSDGNGNSYGKSLDNVFFEKAQFYKKQKNYEKAIYYYNESLSINPNYGKSRNFKKLCEDILAGESKNKTEPQTPDNVSDNSTVTLIETPEPKELDFSNSNETNFIDHPELIDNEIQQDFTSQYGGGFGKSEKNRKVEKAAIKFVTKLYENDEWNVKSVENDKLGYDLVCTKDGITENVEVKGISGKEQSFIITANELNQAKNNPQFILFIVNSALDNSPIPKRYSGTEILEKFDLKPIQYMVKLKD
jgi:tetratricopeptide (TPR) repeat protein